MPQFTIYIFIAFNIKFLDYFSLDFHIKVDFIPFSIDFDLFSLDLGKHFDITWKHCFDAKKSIFVSRRSQKPAEERNARLIPLNNHRRLREDVKMLSGAKRRNAQHGEERNRRSHVIYAQFRITRCKQTWIVSLGAMWVRLREKNKTVAQFSQWSSS